MIADTSRLFIPSKNSLDRYLFPPVCVNWSAKVMAFIPQEKLILLDRFQWLFKICLLRTNLWSKNMPMRRNLDLRKEKKLTCIRRNLQNSHYPNDTLYLDLTPANSSQLVLFFLERRTITCLNLHPLSDCKQGCHQLSLCTKIIFTFYEVTAEMSQLENLHDFCVHAE